MVEKDRPQNVRPSNMSTRRRPSRNAGNVRGTRGATRDFTVRFEARAPARAYAICAREEASSPDFLLKLLVEIIEFMIKVSNPLGKYVLVDKLCKNYLLMTQGYCFPADLMLLPFDEFDVVLGMVWLTMHDAVVNCRRKIIELKC
ncbi:brassinosteroid insensitive 1-like protein [Gossypium australe]|uniref:Brassinosteroid insensitive 1-like protein n=1 Tax=Gossypium australe TaxID=47621 RepID=A0A5B6X565_9ROSI|nr:brassinosteroid insensitive 1-like protein [Gossypium australe]